MGKKGKWLSAIKRVFVHHSKDKQVNELERKNSKDTRKKNRGETKSFIPIFREPSSIEEILGEVDEQKLLIRPITPFEPPKTPQPLLTPRAASPKATPPRVTSPRGPPPGSIRVPSPRASFHQVASPKAASSRDVNRHKEATSYRPEPTLRYRHLSATKIQAAYRGFAARRSFRALRGLVRLQRVVRGQNVKRQTGNAMKMMQLLVRVQTQIQSRRLQMLDNQAFQRQAYKFDMELESSLGNWAISQSEAGNQDDWDDSTLTKEEREARMQKRMEAVFKRERAMAYAHTHQSWKSNSKSAQPSVSDIRPSSFPWWRNWTHHQLPVTTPPPENQPLKTSNLTPPRRTPEPKPSPRPHSSYKSPHHTPFNNNSYEPTTPTSTRSMAPLRSKHFMTTPTHKTPLRSKNFNGLKDDDSITSCSTFSAPNYMTPTASAKAKARAISNPKERFPETNDSKKRFSFPLTPNIGSFKWNKKKDSDLKKASEKQQSFDFADDFSVNSAVSMPATVGRKPFNRFV